MQCRYIAYILRETKLFRKKHEKTGQRVVQIAVSSPERSMHYIFASTVGLGTVNMAQDHFVDLACDDGSCKACILSTLDCIVQERSFLFAIFVKRLLGGRESCSNLDACQHMLKGGGQSGSCTSSQSIKLGHPVEMEQ